MIITEEIIEEAKQKGASPAVLQWLREKPRTVQGLKEYSKEYYMWACREFPELGDKK